MISEENRGWDRAGEESKQKMWIYVKSNFGLILPRINDTRVLVWVLVLINRLYFFKAILGSHPN